MPPPTLFDLFEVDFDRVIVQRETIYERFLRQRHEFMLLDGICHHDRERGRVVSFCQVRPDAWWVRGHVPGRPLMPGVLMLEAAAQTANVSVALDDPQASADRGFVGFGGVEECKFRDAVVPPSTMYILCTTLENRPRRFTCKTQGLVEGRVVFEATISGMAMK
ncbi:MAG: beta-hydroxyacyl-ACP dehydratase [Phycisphaerales bacterium]|nr:MAG: beta-hydroxyacyl-ACP dehydratase [Phycisphaerales bacterium]